MKEVFKKKLEQVPREERRRLIDSASPELSTRRLCELLGLNRSTLYYKENPPSIDDINLLNMIRDIWGKYPFYGYRRITKGEGAARVFHYENNVLLMYLSARLCDRVHLIL